VIKSVARWTGRLALMVAVLGTIGCDRVTKHVATATLAGMPTRSYLAGTVRLGYVENVGGFLSLGADLSQSVRTIIFTGATGLTLVILTALAVRHRWRGWQALGLALFVAGGASNWFDRVVRGSVIDFLNVGIGPVRTGIFNVADVAITLGAAMVVFAGFRHASQGPGTTKIGTAHPILEEKARLP
jgi:signal peptidase II